MLGLWSPKGLQIRVSFSNPLGFMHALSAVLLSSVLLVLMTVYLGAKLAPGSTYENGQDHARHPDEQHRREEADQVYWPGVVCPDADGSVLQHINMGMSPSS